MDERCCTGGVAANSLESAGQALAVDPRELGGKQPVFSTGAATATLLSWLSILGF
jgi:hypothetical protein